MIILIIKLISFVTGILLIKASMKGFKLFFNGELSFIGRGYENKKSAEEGNYMDHSKMLKRCEGMVLNKNGNIVSNSAVSDSEVYLRLED